MRVYGRQAPAVTLRVEKHRRRGEANPRAKLTQAQVDYIRASTGLVSTAWFAKRFKLNERTIRKIRSGERWA